MALAASSPFASFDINAQTQILDISSVLAEALILDFNLMARGLDVAMSDPVEDTTFYWNEEALNPDQVVLAASAASTGTSISLTTGHGARVHIGDLVRDLRTGSTETMEVTDISTDTLTVTRTYNSTVAASLASNATLVVEPAFQEGSDIGADKSVKPIARNNFTWDDLGAPRCKLWVKHKANCWNLLKLARTDYVTTGEIHGQSAGKTFGVRVCCWTDGWRRELFP